MAILAQIKVWLIAAGAAIAALFGVYIMGRQNGGNAAREKAKEADQVRSMEIENAADKARATSVDDPIEQLRRANRLRD